MHEDGLQYYLPLTPGQDGVLLPTAAADLRGNDLPLVSDLAEYIERNYTAERGVIDIAGRRYEGEVLKPICTDDHWYVVVNGMGLPCSARTCDRELLQSELATLDTSWAPIWFSEAMSPQESISVHDSFIEPVFSEVSKTSPGNRLSWNTLLDSPRVVILGGPGAGKTTTLRRMAYTYLERWKHDKSQIYPIYVQMRSIQFGEGVERIVRASLGIKGEKETHQENSLEILDQRVILILDGIDEVPDSLRNEVVAAIQKFASMHISINIVVSTRESGFNWKLSSFRHVRILPFTPNNVREWSYFRFGSSARREWVNFITSLEERESVNGLAGNPLFLSLAVSLFRRSSTFPQSRAVLIKSYIDAMTEGWDSVRGVVRQREPWAAPRRKISALCSAAYSTRARSRDHFSYVDFTAWSEAVGEEPSLLLLSCERDTGLVKRVSSDKWSFSHRLFADFLAAQFIVEHTGDALDHLDPLIESGDWMDVWAFACGISHNASELVQFILKAKNIANEKKIDALSAAFEQDIVVSKSVLKRSASFIEKEVRRLMDLVRVGKKNSGRTREQEFHLSADSSGSEVERARLVILSVRRLRKSKMGEELAYRLRDIDEEVIYALIELLETDSLALVADSEVSDKTIVLKLDDDLIGLADLAREFRT